MRVARARDIIYRTAAVYPFWREGTSAAAVSLTPVLDLICRVRAYLCTARERDNARVVSARNPARAHNMHDAGDE